MSRQEVQTVELSNLRQQAKAIAKPHTERRVYNLPEDLARRVIQFQIDQGFRSETAAVRELLDAALSVRGL